MITTSRINYLLKYDLRDAVGLVVANASVHEWVVRMCTFLFVYCLFGWLLLSKEKAKDDGFIFTQ